MNTIRNVFFWIAVTIATLFFVLLMVESYREWWKVKMNDQTGTYPWGPVNDNPWYYHTPELYSTLTLAEGLALSAAIFMLIGRIIKNDKINILYCLMLCFGLLVLMLVIGGIR